MNIGSHLPVGIITPTKLYLEQYTPDLENSVTQFPIGRFHSQVDTALVPPLNICHIETDLKNDEFLRLFLNEKGILKEGSIMNRKTAIIKEDLCRKVHAYARKINAAPSLVLSQYEWYKYLIRCGGECSSFYQYVTCLLYTSDAADE